MDRRGEHVARFLLKDKKTRDTLASLEYDVSKAYGVLAPEGLAPPQPEDLQILEVTGSSVSASCVPVDGASHYQWFLNGIPITTTSVSTVLLQDLTASTSYTIQVAAIASGIVGPASAPVSFTTQASENPSWQASIPNQSATIGIYFELDLDAFVTDQTAFARSYAIATGSLPTGLSVTGSKILGIPSAGFSGAVSIRLTHAAHPALHQADSNSFSFTVLSADTTAPPVPTDFAAVGYSSSQVLLTWTQPADDTTVPGQIKSGLSHVGIYKDGTFLAQVANSASPNNSYIAEAITTSLWKIRSADLAGNRSAFTAELSAGPTALLPSAPVNVVATRTSSLQATLSWAAGSGPTPSAYKVYQSLSSSGPWTQTAYAGSTPSYVASSGFTGAQTPYFYIVAVVGGQDSPPSAIVSADAGTLGPLTDYGFDSGVLTNNIDDGSPQAQGPSTCGWRRLSGPNSFNEYDAFDPASGDEQCKLITSPVRYSPPGGTGKAMRTILTFHTGASSFPNNNNQFFDSATWYHKGGSLTNDRAHRNEVRMIDHTVALQTEYWCGFSLLVPVAGNPWGMFPTEPMAFFGSYRYPIQLHGPTGRRNPVLFISTNAGWDGLAAIPHPADAPIVRAYQRGGETYGTLLQPPPTSSANDMRVEFGPPVSGPTPVSYRMFRSVRPGGPFVQVGSDIPANTLSSQTNVNVRPSTPNAQMGRATISSQTVIYYQETNLGKNNDGLWSAAYVYLQPVYSGGSLGPASLVSVAPREYYGVGGRTYDSLPGSGESGAGFGRSFIRLAEHGNHWADFVLNFKLGNANNGFLQVWMNDVSVFYANPLSIGEPVEGHYWKAGTYHGRLGDPLSNQNLPPDWAKKFEVCLDEFKHCTKTGGLTGQKDIYDSGYEAVRPRGVRT